MGSAQLLARRLTILLSEARGLEIRHGSLVPQVHFVSYQAKKENKRENHDHTDAALMREGDNLPVSIEQTRPTHVRLGIDTPQVRA